MSNGTQLIGLAGYARVGKDEVAKYLVQEHGFTRIAFADAIRDALYVLDPLIRNHGHLNETRLVGLVDYFGWDKCKEQYPEVRRLLQVFGTEVGREMVGPDVWVDIAMRKITPGGKYVFTDVRFPNEADAINEAGGKVWRIVRPGFGPVNGHGSETALDDAKFDVCLINSATIGCLQGLAKWALSEVGAGA